MTTLEEQVRNLFLTLGVERGDESENLAKALFYAIKKDGTHRLVHIDGDIYDGLENLPSIFTLSATDAAIAIETTGWASPLDEGSSDDDQIAPSQHPKRRRVRLLSIVTRTYECASALGFADNEEIVTDSGEARGTLADALLVTMTMMLSKTN
jgi:hypothetical protein